MKLLLVSADPVIQKAVAEESQAQNWFSHIMSDRAQVLDIVKSFDPDMMMVDVSATPELDWWEQQGLTDLKPTLFMHGKVDEEFLTRSFEVGADGFMPKNFFSRRYLAARVNAYLRRQGLADARRFVPRLGLVLDSQRYRVDVKGRGLALTLTEYKILRALSTEEEIVVSRREIQSQVFGDTQISKRSLDVHICALRKKLRPFDLDISSVRGVGYGLNLCTK